MGLDAQPTSDGRLSDRIARLHRSLCLRTSEIIVVIIRYCRSLDNSIRRELLEERYKQSFHLHFKEAHYSSREQLLHPESILLETKRLTHCQICQDNSISRAKEKGEIDGSST